MDHGVSLAKNEVGCVDREASHFQNGYPIRDSPIQKPKSKMVSAGAGTLASFDYGVTRRRAIDDSHPACAAVCRARYLESVASDSGVGHCANPGAGRGVQLPAALSPARLKLQH